MGDEDLPAWVRSGDRLLVIANPVTRRNIRAIIDTLRGAVPEGVTIDVRITRRAGEARDLARRHAPGSRMVVAVGGDGTVADVASEVVAMGIPLAILPGGSTNIIARELGIPTDIHSGTALIRGPHAHKRIDVGRADRRHFVHMAGVGFDSRLFARANSRLKRKIGWLAYLPGAARSLLDRPSFVTVTVDDSEVSARSPLVLVANGRAVAHPKLAIATGISSSDGMFDVFIVTATGLIPLARVLGRLAMRQLDHSPYVTRLRGKRVTIDAEPSLPVEFDGDVDGSTPVELEIIPGALDVVVPLLNARKGR
ncbi:MAG: diacylglycerol kinase family lipid kinase [Chloroflexota bacterium]|nr:diacylglycerol kinase family lipid kinase [Chloroflexota bacterium]